MEDNTHMKKDFVTPEHIAQDYKNTHFTYLEIYRTLAIVVVVGVLYMIFSLTHFLIAFYLLAPLVAGGYLIHILLCVRAYIKIRKGKFRTEQDMLINADGRSGVERIGPGYKPCFLHFRRYGRFQLLEGSYYKWSPNFSTTSDGICDRSMTKDIFLLVIIDKKTIVAVYNLKLFELQ